MDKILGEQAHQQIFLTLYNNQVCVRCILRVLKIESLEFYRDKSKIIQILGRLSEIAKLQVNLLHTYDILKIIKKSQNSICKLCLGLLQQCDNQENIKMIGEAIRKQKFVFQRFKFLVRTPNSLVLRFSQMIHFIQHHLETLGPDFQTNLFNNWENKHIQVKTALKWIMAPLLSTEIESHSTIEDDCLQIHLKFDNPKDDQLYFSKFAPTLKAMAEQKLSKKLQKVQKKMKPEKFQQLKENVQKVDPSAANMNRILAMDQQYFFKSVLKSQFCHSVQNKCSFEIQIRCGSVFLFGNYVKYSRYLSQTPWVVYGKKLTESSIQQELQKVLLKHFYPEQMISSDNVKFHSGGREDIDVRMLSTGRPFALEFCSPRYTTIVNQQGIIKQLQEQINHNKYLRVNSLKFTDSKCLQILKKSEIQKIKAYSCFVHFQKPFAKEDIQRLNSIQDLVLNQKTPLRVLHRRTLMVRKKVIHKLFASPIDDKNMILNVLASAGTYIKQFVHGDLERTSPNINSLTNNQADIFQLDVLKLYEKLDKQAITDFLEVAVKVDAC